MEDTKSKKVLVIDDEYFVCRSISKILDGSDVETDIAMSGREGLVKARGARYDLVLVDVKMSEMNGYVVVRMLKEITPEMPVLVISGYNTSHTAEQALNCGGVEFVPKPFTPDELKNVVDKYLRGEYVSEAPVAPVAVETGGAEEGPAPVRRDAKVAVGYTAKMPREEGGELYFREQRHRVAEFAREKGLELAAVYEDMSSDEPLMKRPAVNGILAGEKTAGVLLVDSLCYVARSHVEMREFLEVLDREGMRLETVSFLMDKLSQFVRRWYENRDSALKEFSPDMK